MQGNPQTSAPWYQRLGAWCRDRSVVLLVGGVLLLGIVLVVEFWPEFRSGSGASGDAEPLSATIRNLALIAGGFIAVILTVWRIRVNEQQAETARLGLLNERFQRGAQMLGDSILTVRLGGIHALDDLARERPDLYHIRVMLLLCAFVRHLPAADESPATITTGEGETLRYRKRADLSAAILAVANRSASGKLIEEDSDLPKERILDLQGSDLRGARLGGSDFSGANFREAQLDRVGFLEANLSGADFGNAKLPWANLIHADLSNAQMSGADLTKAMAQHTNFRNAHFTATMQEMSLLRADLTEADIGTADLRGADLTECDLSDARFAEATRSTLWPSGDHESRKVYAKLTQAQLDKAVCKPGRPPSIAAGTVDVETGLPLEWRGGNRHPRSKGQSGFEGSS